MSVEFYEEVARRLRSGQTLALATVIEAQGSTPRRFGTRMIILESGETVFSIGGGAFEALIVDDARRAIREGRGCEREYRFTETGENALGMVCGGSARVLIEVVPPPVPLFVFGGGHVGREVAVLGRRLGFDVTVVEDRTAFLDAARYPEGVRCRRVGPDYEEGLPEIARGAFVVIVTRCHRTDLAVLRGVVRRGAAYVGVIGSRRKVATILDRAAALGIPKDALAEVRGPIGVPIGAQTPEEIAVSIAAEMIHVRRAAPAAGARRSAEVLPIRRVNRRQRDA